MVMPRNVPSDSSQKKVIKAFKKMGWIVEDPRWGSGSHRLVRDPKSGYEQVIQSKIYKECLKTYCKVLEVNGYDASTFVRLV